MPREEFRWEAVPQLLLRRLARDLALPGDPARALQERYGRRPKPGFVRDAWPTLRDAWLAKDAPARRGVVEELRAGGLGGTGLPVRTRAQQLAYLASCRNAPRLRAVVLAAFHSLGEVAAEPDGFDRAVDAAWAEFATTLEAVLREEGAAHVTLPSAGGHGPEIAVGPEAGRALATRLTFPSAAAAGPPVDRAEFELLDSLGWAFDLSGRRPGAALDGRLGPARIAAAVVVTMRDVFGVVHPSFLAAQLAPPPGARSAERLAELVDAALAARLQATPERDADGDVVVDFGPAVGYVRVAADSPHVSVFAPLLYGVPGDPLVLERLNQLNRSWRLVRFTWAGGVVTATLDLWCSPFVPELLRQAVDTLAAVVHQLPDLQLRLGGHVCGCVDDD